LGTGRRGVPRKDVVKRTPGSEDLNVRFESRLWLLLLFGVVEVGGEVEGWKVVGWKGLFRDTTKPASDIEYDLEAG
jgi:hypothetical protein